MGKTWWWRVRGGGWGWKSQPLLKYYYDIYLQAPRKTTQNIGKLYLRPGLLTEIHPRVTCSIRIKPNQSTHLSFESAVPKVQ
jgi:hypothetical protein